MLRSIKQHVQLVTQSNDCCLLSYPEMKIRFERAWDLMEFTRNPEEFLYLHPNRTAFAPRSPWTSFYSYARNIPLYHQKVRLLHIYQSGYLAGKPYTFFSKRKDLYLHFINIKDRARLAQFVNSKEDFCFFPNEQEAALLKLKYRETIGTEGREFVYPMKEKNSQDIERKTTEDMEKIRSINIDFIWEKKEWLRERVESYRKGTMTLRELALLNRNMTQVAEILLNQDDFTMLRAEKTVNEKLWPDERGFNKIIGEERVSDVRGLVSAYRVYGHFAFCCLEFFLSIRERKNIDRCVACSNYYEKDHGNKRFCSSRCKKLGAAKRSDKYRSNKTK